MPASSSRQTKDPSLTKNQAMVFQALREAQTPLSAYTILDRLRDDGFRAPAQVYRALEKLLELGLIHRLETLNAYVACSHAQGHQGSIVFAICADCGEVDEFTDQVIGAQLAQWASIQRFTLDQAIVELRGHCGQCGGSRNE